MLLANELAVLNAARRDILFAALRTSGAATCYLFEVDENAQRYQLAACTSTVEEHPEPVALSSRSLLVRWFRANRAYLPIPDSIGVCNELDESSRRLLTNLQVCGFCPLVHNDDLIALVAVRGTAPTADGIQRLMLQSATWGSQLDHERAEYRRASLSENAARNNRLTVTGQMAASIAHEVRNPLAALRSTVQMVRDRDVRPEAQQAALDSVLSEVDRIEDVLSDMMTAGKPSRPVHEPCDLAEIVQDAAAFLRAYTRRAQQTIHISDAAQAIVLGDAYKLRQVFVNVLLNACQASTHNTAINVTVSVDSEAKTVTVLVQDHGCGVPAHQLARVFEAFYTTKHDGGGLGLAICREIIERHGGTISLGSTPGRGTTATITLPAGSDNGANPRH